MRRQPGFRGDDRQLGGASVGENAGLLEVDTFVYGSSARGGEAETRDYRHPRSGHMGCRNGGVLGAAGDGGEGRSTASWQPAFNSGMPMPGR